MSLELEQNCFQFSYISELFFKITKMAGNLFDKLFHEKLPVILHPYSTMNIQQFN